MKSEQPNSWVRANCIGQGSFGTVSLAVDKSDAHIFAVKSVEHKLNDDSQLEALENEIKILKSLSSPYVISYVGDDSSTENSTRYRNLHLEYMPGGTAAELALSGDEVDEGIIRGVTSCVVSALKYVHSLGIVHGDVKGRNVLVGSRNGTAKLADFGSAVESTNCMRPRGSPLWMAPEVIRGEYQGPESDVWSLGCTLIEMVTGKPAWEDKGAHTLCRIGYSDELPSFPAQLSELGRDFLSKCLRRDRKERWSCDQLLQHEFLVSSCPSADWSPRCTLDWLNSSFSDEDDDQDKKLFNSEASEFDAKQRIRVLASKSGAVWEESDGWLAVRTTIEKEISCQWGDVEEMKRTILETPESTKTFTGKYWDSVGTPAEEGGRANLEYSTTNYDAILLNELDHNYFFTAGGEAGSSCRSEFKCENYSYCNNFIAYTPCLYYGYFCKFRNKSLYIKLLFFTFSVRIIHVTSLLFNNYDYVRLNDNYLFNLIKLIPYLNISS